MELKFGEWLAAQRDRDDLVGDIARVPAMQIINAPSSTRKVDEHKNWVNIVVRLAPPGHVDSFNKAWQEFLLARQTAEEART